MILLTGATGNVGSKVADLLLDKGIEFKATSRHSKEDEKVNWLQVDFEDKQSIRTAFEGVDTLIIITPANKNMVEHQLNLIEMASLANVSKIVKLSGLGSGPDAPIRLPKFHYEIEEQIKKLSKSNAIDYVFVRPNLFMQAVIYGSLETIQSEGKLYAPVTSGKISLIDTSDIAQIIVESACNSGIKNEAIEITGPEALSFNDIATSFSKKLGNNVEFVPVSFADAKKSMLDSGMDAWLIDAFIELYEIYEQNMGSSILTERFESITKIIPMSFDERLKTLSLD